MGCPCYGATPGLEWVSPAVKEAPSVPVFFDCTVAGARALNLQFGPPPYEDSHEFNSHLFINRHDAGVNYLFLDWSVRKVGLKELFSLKWYVNWPMDNPWTKAGGVQPEDWPLWMRKFKDY